MRIVHAANFNTFKYGTDFYSTDRKITSGFIKNGHFVYDFSYRDILRGENFFKTTKYGIGKLNDRLLSACKMIQPDLLMLGHSELIEAETLDKIKKAVPGVKTGMWYVDPLFNTHKTSFIFPRLRYLDAFFATTGGEYLKSFKNDYGRAAFFPNIVDESFDCYRNFGRNDFLYDFLFCGRDHGEPERKAFLSELIETLKKNSLACELRGALGNPLAFGAEFMNLLGQSKMGLNYSRKNDVYMYSSDRIVQLAGNGLLTFCPRVPGFEMLYDDTELVYFHDLDELIEKVKYYVQNDDERKTVAENGWNKTHASFNSQRVCQFMEDVIFQKKYSEEYEWGTELFK